jgi:hypothetical protein
MPVALWCGATGSREVAMTNKVLSIETGHTLGLLGLFLMLVIAHLVDPAYRVQHGNADRLTGFLARRAIDGIAGVGWLVDRLPL